MEPSTEEDIPYRNLVNAMKEQAEEDKRFLGRAHVAFEQLNLYNSFYAEQLVELAEVLAEFALDEDIDPVSPMEIDQEYGKGINLYRIISALNDYDEGNDTQCLDAAFAYILREKERRNLWD